MILIILAIILLILVVYLMIDLLSTNPNAFYDKWAKKTLFIWLPFYALQRLIKEIFFDKK